MSQPRSDSTCGELAEQPTKVNKLDRTDEMCSQTSIPQRAAFTYHACAAARTSATESTTIAKCMMTGMERLIEIVLQSDNAKTAQDSAHFGRNICVIGPL